MIERSASAITDWLIECEVIRSTERELYHYAVYSALLTISPLILALLVGSLVGAVGRSMMIIFPFVVIRKFSGGFHAKRPVTCFVSSSVLLTACIFLSFCIQCNWILMGITFAAAVSLIYFSPIENENRLLSGEEKIRYKRIAMILVLGFVVTDLLLFLSSLHTYAICISIGLILTACLQYPCIWKICLKNDQY